MLYSQVREPNVRKRYAVGDVVDERYELRRALGRGVRGTVFEAFHRFRGNLVALKILSRDVPVANRSKVRERLSREARALAAAHHRGLVEILDGGVTSDGTPFAVFEMLTGRTLEGVLAARGSLPAGAALGVAMQLCDAMGAAHAAGVVHRNLKPANIFMTATPGTRTLKIADFGIAQFDAVRDRGTEYVGGTLGTPHYEAPEQLESPGDVDLRADVYAIGVILYECLTGLCSDVDVDQAGLEPGVAAIIARATAPNRDDRYETTAHLRRALEAALPPTGRDTSPREWSPRSFITPPELPSVLQRRRLPRAPYATPVHIQLPTGETIDARNEDISEGGMLVLARAACEPGQHVTVRFALPIDGTVHSFNAEVRWVRASRPGDPRSARAIGLGFRDLPAHAAATISRYVSLRSE